MIRFEGEFSNICKRFLMHELTISILISTIVVFILFSFLPIMLAVMLDMMWIIFAYIAMFATIFIVIIALDKSPKNIEENYKTSKPDYIEILKDGSITLERKVGGYIKTIEDVKEIVDYGEFYHIAFYFTKGIGNAFCQKDLIVKGSIEEFEKCFEGKIIKKELKIK